MSVTIGTSNSYLGTPVADVFAGGLFDWIIKGYAGNDSLTGNVGSDTIFGGLGDDTIDGSVDGCDSLVGGAGDDVIIAGGTNNSGVVDIDTLIGGGGKDKMDAGDGNDFLFGGGGADTLIGGMGDDVLTGGAGGDRFRFNNCNEGIDRITDFGNGNDKIVVKNSGFGGSFSAPTTLPATQFFLLSPFGTSPQFIYDNTTGDLFFDQDGTNTAFPKKQIAVLVGAPSLIASQIMIVP